MAHVLVSYFLHHLRSSQVVCSLWILVYIPLKRNIDASLKSKAVGNESYLNQHPNLSRTISAMGSLLKHTFFSPRFAYIHPKADALQEYRCRMPMEVNRSVFSVCLGPHMPET
jgi:hypothetical protein